MKTLLVAVAVAVIGLLGTRLSAQAPPGQAPGAAQEPAPAPAPAADAAHAPAQGTGAAPDAAHAPGHAPAHGPAGAHGAAGDGHAGGDHADAGPVPPKPPLRWVFVLVFLIAMMFLAAAVVGPVVRAHAPPEMPATHSHDEPPGASHHHGHTGTINPVPEDVQRLEDAHGHDHH